MQHLDNQVIQLNHALFENLITDEEYAKALDMLARGLPWDEKMHLSNMAYVTLH